MTPLNRMLRSRGFKIILAMLAGAVAMPALVYGGLLAIMGIYDLLVAAGWSDETASSFMFFTAFLMAVGAFAGRFLFIEWTDYRRARRKT